MEIAEVGADEGLGACVTGRLPWDAVRSIVGLEDDNGCLASRLSFAAFAFLLSKKAKIMVNKKRISRTARSTKRMVAPHCDFSCSCTCVSTESLD
mmetsp:Transcript_4252/g.7486  ORF Transcript_4252/g.7486 Transcript_4252/m.7486 type:complete len:95 (-) Transcript_4252:297-581(-)